MRIQLSIRAVPNAGRDACAGLMEDGATWKIRIAAPAVDGKANAALIACMAKLLGVPKGAVTLTAGQTSRSKRISVEGIDEFTAMERLTAAVKSK